jgi:hypothetical protein
MGKFIISRFLVLMLTVICAILPSRSPRLGIQATLDEIAKTDPRAKQVKAEQLIDRRFLEEMEKDGTFERLGLAR